MGKWKLPIIVILLVGAMFAIFAIGGGNSAPEAEAQKMGTKHENQGQEHISDGASHVEYNSNLPSSGPHYIKPADWGTYENEIPPETFIHNLEHGGIVIAYKPDLAKEKIDKLKEVVSNLPKNPQFNNVKVILMPRAKNDKPIQMAAWTHTYDMEDVDEAKIEEFYNSHINKGPELVP